MSKTLFGSVKYWICPSISSNIRKELENLLNEGNATSVSDASNPEDLDLDNITHVITDTVYIQRWSQIKEYWDTRKLHVVTPLWVTRSHDLQFIPDPRFYSPESDMIFSGVCVSVSGLPVKDEEVIRGVVSAFGGQHRDRLVKDVTHLVVLAPRGDAYDAALKFGTKIGMKIVLPTWIDDCIKLRQRVPEDAYMFPDPPLLNENTFDGLTSGKKTNSVPEDSEQTETMRILENSSNCQYEKELYKKGVTRSRLDSSCNSGDIIDPQEVTEKLNPISENILPIFKDKRVYLSSCLHLRSTLANALITRINNAGGVACVGVNIERMDHAVACNKVVESDIIICHRRSGWEFWTAFENDRMIGNMHWLLHVLQIQRLDPPRNRLLHFPFPEGTIPNFNRYKVCLSNYSGDARDLIKHMLSVMGADYSGSLDPTNTHLIAAVKDGRKVQKAEEWEIPIVNHLWLEECFVKWKDVSFTHEPFTYFTPGVDYVTSLADRSLEHGSIESWVKCETAKQDRQKSMAIFNRRPATISPEKAPAVVVESPAQPNLNENRDDRGDASPFDSPSKRKSTNPNTERATPRSKTISPIKPADLETPNRQTIATSRTSTGKRKAASAASEKLQENMEDLASYEREKRRKSTKGYEESGTLSSSLSTVTTSRAGQSVKKSTPSNNRGPLQSNDLNIETSAQPENSEDDGDDVSVDDVASSPVNKKKSANSSAKDDPKRSRRSVTAEKETPNQKTLSKPKVLTTGFTPSDDLIKNFERMGAKVITKPAECTHVVTNNISRTEKFLCALPNAPAIVTEEWMVKSVKAGELLDEKPFYLTDKAGEKKWKFSLTQSLDRASSSKLLDGHVFFITSHVAPDSAILERIIKANGGKVSKAAPSVRQFDGSTDTKHLISCEKDQKIWKPISDSKVPVYMPELILEGVLKQQLNWKGHKL